MTEGFPETDLTVGSLYVVATPIGNLSDLSQRAAATLRAADVVAAEDTRTTRVLLDHIGAKARLTAAHRHNEREAAERIVAWLREGQRVALVSDAGTPAVSDPGARIVAAVWRAGLRVVPVPGPSAPIALLSACGLVEGAFHFEGFLPARARGRDQRLAALAALPHPFVLFEAPHRIAQTLPAIAAACGPGRWLALGRELTKRFEEIHVCSAAQAIDWLQADANRERGEYVIVVAAVGYRPDGGAASGRGAGAGTWPDAGAGAGNGDDDRNDGDGDDRAAGGTGRDDSGEPAGDLTGTAPVSVDVQALLRGLLAELPLSRAVKVAERATGLQHRALYRMALALRGDESSVDD